VFDKDRGKLANGQSGEVGADTNQPKAIKTTYEKIGQEKG
jgi:hypothetical protein